MLYLCVATFPYIVNSNFKLFKCLCIIAIPGKFMQTRW